MTAERQGHVEWHAEAGLAAYHAGAGLARLGVSISPRIYDKAESAAR